MKGKGVPNLVSDISLRILPLIKHKIKMVALSYFKTGDALIKHQSWIYNILL